MQDALLQAFHLSKPKKGPTYIWADTGRQQYHDSFSSKHGDAGGKGSDSDADEKGSCKQIPARHSVHGNDPLQQLVHSKKIPDYARIRQERGRNHLHLNLSGAREHLSKSLTGADQNPVQLQLCVDGLTSESVSKLLAMHARTERRARSLIDKVHALKRDCIMLVMALPHQHEVEDCASP